MLSTSLSSTPLAPLMSTPRALPTSSSAVALAFVLARPLLVACHLALCTQATPSHPRWVTDAAAATAAKNGVKIAALSVVDACPSTLALSPPPPPTTLPAHVRAWGQLSSWRDGPRCIQSALHPGPKPPQGKCVNALPKPGCAHPVTT